MDDTPATISRRRVVKTAAWSVPAVTLATAAPAFADSGVVNPAVRGGDLLLNDLGYVRDDNGTPLYLLDDRVAPAVRLTGANVGDVALTQFTYTFYVLVDADITTQPPATESLANGWTRATPREIIGADVELLQGLLPDGLTITAGVGRAYDFVLNATVDPGAPIPELVANLTPYEGVGALTNLLTGLGNLLSFSYVKGMYDGSYEYAGRTIGDAAAMNVLNAAPLN